MDLNLFQQIYFKFNVPLFSPVQSSILFNENGETETWESDPNAPHEMLLSMSTPKDFDYDPYMSS